MKVRNDPSKSDQTFLFHFVLIVWRYTKTDAREEIDQNFHIQQFFNLLLTIFLDLVLCKAI